MDICKVKVNQVINFLLAIPILEEFIFNVSGLSRSISLITFPSQLRRFELRGFSEIYGPKGVLSIYCSLYFINQLSMKRFVCSSFLPSTQRKRLEFLDFLGITNKNSYPYFNFSNCDNQKELKRFSIIESLTVKWIDST